MVKINSHGNPSHEQFFNLRLYQPQYCDNLVLQSADIGYRYCAYALFITKSWKQALIGLLPNVVPLSIAVWVFSIFGFSLNILTAITATVCIGLLDDDTVHLLYRKFVLKQPVNTLANSIVNTAILLAVGFGFFLMSDFYPTQVFGGVSALVFVFGILGELTLFQVVMDWIQPKSKSQ